MSIAIVGLSTVIFVKHFYMHSCYVYELHYTNTLALTLTSVFHAADLKRSLFSTCFYWHYPIFRMLRADSSLSDICWKTDKCFFSASLCHQCHPSHHLLRCCSSQRFILARSVNIHVKLQCHITASIQCDQETEQMRGRSKKCCESLQIREID